MRVRYGRSWAGRWSGNLDPVPDPWAVWKVIGSLEGRRTLRGAATASGSGGFEGIGAGIEAVGSSVTHERDPRKGGSTPGNRPGSVAVDPVRPLFGAVADLTPEALRKLASRVSLPPRHREAGGSAGGRRGGCPDVAGALLAGVAAARARPLAAVARRASDVLADGMEGVRAAVGCGGGGMSAGGASNGVASTAGHPAPVAATHPLRTAPTGPPEKSRSSWPPIVRSQQARRGRARERPDHASRSRQLTPVFPLSRHGPAGSSTTAGSADRAAL